MWAWQPRQNGRFLPEAAARFLVCLGARGQDLQRDVATELLVLGALDLAHAPGAESLLDAVWESVRPITRTSRQC
jgi:hypothetical protein